jgi:hypothetical protein
VVVWASREVLDWLGTGHALSASDPSRSYAMAPRAGAPSTPPVSLFVLAITSVYRLRSQ